MHLLSFSKTKIVPKVGESIQQGTEELVVVQPRDWVEFLLKFNINKYKKKFVILQAIGII